MNLERLSKKAVSYSSASMTNSSLPVWRGGDREILRYTADEKARRASRAFENPGEHRRDRGLAMGAGHGEDMPARQHMLSKPLRPGDVALASVEDRLH